MARTLLFSALALALLSLALTIFARTRYGQGAQNKRPLDAFLLIPLAIVVGVLPGIFGATSSSLGIGASLVSIILSVSGMVLMRRGYRRR